MRRPQKGVTLIEVMLALGILAVALLSLIAVFTSGLKLARASDQVTTASTVGQEFLELVKGKGYTQTAVGTYDGRVSTPQDTATGFPFAPYPSVKRESGDYTLVVDCQDVTSTIRGVKVEVYWDTQKGGKVTFYTQVHQ